MLKRFLDILPNDVLSSVIRQLFTVHDYGLCPTDFPSSSSMSARIPAALQIRCWEANEPERYFSEEECAVLNARRKDRALVRMECEKLLEQMDDLEKMELLQGEKVDEKSPQTERVSPCSPLRSRTEIMSSQGSNQSGGVGKVRPTLLTPGEAHHL